MAAGIANAFSTPLIGDLSASYALLYSSSRAISYLVPHVTVEEVHQDALGITGYPVESGATLADHSFKLPARLEMIVGWSNSTAADPQYCYTIYQKLLALQATRYPFDIMTGKRMYRNMLMEALVNVTSKEFEYAMLPRITFRELLISRTQTSNAADTQPAASNANQSMPEKTGSVVDQGTVQPQLVNFGGDNGTAYGGYDPSLAIGARTSVGTVDGLTVVGVGTFDSNLGEVTSTLNPGALGGNAGLFGRYAPESFTNVQPFRI